MRLTKSTVAYLANLASEAGNNQEVRSTLGKAYLGTGDLQGYPDAPNLGDTTGALASYQAAEKLLGPDDHIPLARVYWHRGVVLFKSGNVPEGLPWLKRGIAEVERLDSRDALIVHAFALHSLAYALTPSDPEQALIFSRRESEIFTQLALRDPDDAEAQNGLADSYNAIGGALLRRNRLEEALSLFTKGTAVMEAISAKHPTDVMMRRDLLNAYLHVGDALGNPARRNLGDRRGALPYYRKAQVIAETLATADPSNRLAQMDLLEVVWRAGVVLDTAEDAQVSLEMLDSARERALRIASGKALNTTLARIVATIDEFRGWRLVALRRLPESVTAFQNSFDVAQAIAKRDPTDSSAATLMLLDRSGMCQAMASLGRREDAVDCSQQAIAHAVQMEANGPDRPYMALYVPRTNMWLGAVYETLAKRHGSPERQADWVAAAKNYTQASEAWKKLHGRADIVRYRLEIDEAAKKVAECNRRASSRV
jgi:tetratricopeptide (TPR) repeat protein